MTCVFLTGIDSPDLHKAWGWLERAGVSPAKHSSAYSEVTFESWHRDVLEASRLGQFGIRPPGRIWEQTAADLTLSNRRSRSWGWCSPLLMPLLDFWHEFDPKIYFVLIAEELDRAISRFIHGNSDLATLPEFLLNWRLAHQEMLKFHFRHPSQSLLIWGHEADTNGHHFLTLVAGLLRVDGVGPLHQDTAMSEEALVREGPVDGDGGISNALTQFLVNNVCDAAPDLVALQDELLACVRPCLPDAVVSETKSSAEIFVDSKTAIPFAIKLIGGYRASRQPLLDEINEARERYLAEVTKIRTEAAHDAVEFRKLIEAEKLSSIEVIKRLEQEISTLREARSQRDELRDRTGRAEKSVGHFETQLKEAKEENDLILAQLHQVQEELEKYFLELQDVRATLRENASSNARMLGSVEGAFDCESLSLVDPMNMDLWTWRARKVRTVGHSIDALEFKSRIEQGFMAIEVFKTSQDDSQLLRWPAARSVESLTLVATRGPSDGTEWLATLARLSTSDWDMLRGLLKMMRQQIAGGGIDVPQSQVNAMLDAITKALMGLDALRALLRFDTAKVLGENRSPKRHVILMSLTNVSFGGVRLPSLDFQLQIPPGGPAERSATELNGASFLIFNRACADKPFQSWFANAKAAKGEAVMAVPFPEGPVTASIWERFSDFDRQFLSALARALPLCFVDSTASTENIKSSVKEWMRSALLLSRSLASKPPERALAEGSPLQEPLRKGSPAISRPKRSKNKENPSPTKRKPSARTSPRGKSHSAK